MSDTHRINRDRRIDDDEEEDDDGRLTDEEKRRLFRGSELGEVFLRIDRERRRSW